MSELSHPEEQQGENRVAHEVDRINAGSVVRVGAGLVTIVIVAMVGMVYLFRGLDKAVESKLPAYASPAYDLTPPPPRVAPDQSKQLRELRAEHRRILSSYGWVDEEAGVARVPIERAIEMVAEELPVREDRE